MFRSLNINLAKMRLARMEKVETKKLNVALYCVTKIKVTHCWAKEILHTEKARVKTRPVWSEIDRLYDFVLYYVCLDAHNFRTAPPIFCFCVCYCQDKVYVSVCVCVRKFSAKSTGYVEKSVGRVGS